MTLLPSDHLLAAYRPTADSVDEMVEADGEVRTHWAEVAAALGELGPGQLRQRRDEADRLLAEDGVTYHITGGAYPGPRPWVTDPVPLVLPPDEWATLEVGVAQRAELLDLILTDLYGPRDLVAQGLLPPEVVYGHPGFLRPCDQILLPGGKQLFLTAADVARDRDGTHVVLSDRTQAPSGIGYALENRVVVSRVLPGLHRSAQVQRLAPFFRSLRSSLHQIAPPTDDTPRIVVLTPGQWSETAFEHAHLAGHLGVPLVQGSDLRVRDGRVWMRSLGRLEPVHVIIRRVDAAFCDPVELRPDSNLGVPGLLEVCRTGNVSVVNTLGSGVLENPGLLPFLPRIADALLGEPLLLPSVDTWWCGEPTSRRHVLANLDQLVVKPVARDHDSATIIGWWLDAAGLDHMRRRIDAEPHLWVGQAPVAVSTVPTVTGDLLEPRKAVVRTFAVSRGDRYAVMPGGLTRVAAAPDDELITNQTGALSKDTCVLSAEPEGLTGFWLQDVPDADVIEPQSSMSPRAAEHLFWLSRYAERAESLARLLRVISDRDNEFAAGATPAGVACVRCLLSALTMVSGTRPGFVGDGRDDLLADPEVELRSLLADEARPGTLAFDVRRMLDAAAQVRDQLSGDTWLVVGHLDRDLADLDRRLPGAPDQAALGRVMQALLALAGLASESMVRDAGWQFHEAGRRVERALQLSALLDATVTHSSDNPTDSLVLESVLIAAESIITYRHRYRSRAQIETVLDLLVLDPSNPRSLAYQVEALHAAIVALPGPLGRGEPLAEPLALAAANLVRRADTTLLGTTDPDGGRPALSQFLAELSGVLATVAQAVDEDHFSHQVPQRSVFTPNNPRRP
jgi:uncharacterized circularly permuted ATP-grasp superfamily protein/uncharacterized alpha-E superfamily protein